MNNSFDVENQCELSLELLHLLKWMIENETNTLKKLIIEAIKHGYTNKTTNTNTNNTAHDLEATSANMQHNIVDFLDLLDSLLHEVLSEQNVQKAHQHNLMPSLQKIDATMFDGATVQDSIDRAEAQREHKPDANPQDLLYQELLRQWKPNKKEN